MSQIIDKVHEMEDEVLLDGVPNIESAPCPIEYKACSKAESNPVHYADSRGFESDLTEETQAVREIELLLEHGEYFVHLLYCFRSCSRALPMVKSADQPDKADIYNKTFRVLRPEILKLRDLMDFHEEVIRIFCNEVQKLAQATRCKLPVPSALHGALVALVDLLQKLDNLKDMKACLQNDFSFYKRAFQHARTGMSAEEGEKVSVEVHNLQMFLGNPAHPKALIFFNLKDAVTRIAGSYEDVLVDLLEHTVGRLESELYVVPDEKWALLRVMPHLMLLLDAEGSGFNVFTSKKVPLSRAQKLFKRFPVVPVYGDMSIKMAYILERAPHWDSERMGRHFGIDIPAVVRDQYHLDKQWNGMRQRSDAYCPRLASVLNEIKRHRGVLPPGVEGDRMARRVLETVKEGVLLLSAFSSHVLEQVAWKYKHPATDEELAQRVTVKGGVAYASAQPGYEYERVVRYNYSRDELSVLVDSLSLVKALASMLTNAEAVLAPVLRAAMHKEVQSFLVSQTQAPGLTGEGVLTLLHRADKRKRPVKAALLQLRTMGADWFNDVEPVEEYKKKRAEREAAEATRRHKPRALAPSPTQLFLLRAAVETLASDRAPGMQGKGLLSKKDFDKEEVGWLMGFWKSTYFFPYLLDLGGTVQVCADMGDLWYREFYLEMTKQVQFPIDMSLPWILTEHVINNPVALTSHMVENILFAMDIYNDSAHRALNSLHQQYLFQEIEAEVNLCFDQLVFLTSENVYRYYKDVAATRRLDQDFAAEMQAMSGKRHLEANKRRFEVPLLQRHVQLLGRSVDLGEGIGQMLQMKLVADLEMALRRLEAADLGFIVEFESLVATLKATHSLLVEEGCGGLDSWEATWAAANDEVSPGAFRGRLALHAVRVVVFDLVPAYSFAVSTQRFVRSPIRMNAPLDLDSAPRKVPPGFGFGDACKSAYEDAHRLHREFVGVPHVEALCRALGHSGQSVLVDALLAHVRSTLENISPYMAALATLLPPCKLPKFVYRAAGCYGFFEGKLKGVLGYSDLKSTVFQSFRELGNAFALLRMIDATVGTQNALESHFAAPFVGGVNAATGGAVKFSTHDTALTAGMHALASGTMGYGAADGAAGAHARMAPAAGLLAEMSVLGAGSIFQAALQETEAMLRELGLLDVWRGDEQTSTNPVLEVDETVEFYRLWSALQFMFCMDEVGATVSDETEFGDGFAWGGCVFMHLLGQTERFELLDFSYHVCNVQAFDFASDKSDVPEAERPPAAAQSMVAQMGSDMEEAAAKFAGRAALLRGLNSTVFSSLRRAFVPPPVDNLVFHPPDDDSNLDRALPQHAVTTDRMTASTAYKSNSY